MVDSVPEERERAVWAANIADLVERHLNSEGWLVCGCGNAHGFIEKRFDVQAGGGETWEPFIRGAIRLGEQARPTNPSSSWSAMNQLGTSSTFGSATTRTGGFPLGGV